MWLFEQAEGQKLLVLFELSRDFDSRRRQISLNADLEIVTQIFGSFAPRNLERIARGFPVRRLGHEPCVEVGPLLIISRSSAAHKGRTFGSPPINTRGVPTDSGFPVFSGSLALWKRGEKPARKPASADATEAQR